MCTAKIQVTLSGKYHLMVIINVAYTVHVLYLIGRLGVILLNI